MKKDIGVLGNPMIRSHLKIPTHPLKEKNIKSILGEKDSNWYVLYIPENCQSVLKEYCSLEYQELCEVTNTVSKQCSDSYRMICSYVDSSHCKRSRKCDMGLKHECRTEYKKICKSEKLQDNFSVLFNRLVRKCNLVPMKICRKKKCFNNESKLCVNGKQKICQRKPIKICKDVMEQKTNCRNVPFEKCQNIPA